MPKRVSKASATEHAELPTRIDVTPAPPASSSQPVAGAASGVTRIPLSALNQRTVAVCCRIMGREQTLLGRGVYEQDAELGPVLRIDSPEHGDFQLTFAEKSWNGEIFVGGGRDWDFLIRLFN
jgi:hypothetical protein